MSRIFLIIAALLVGIVAVAFLLLGAFPPHVQRQPVEHVLKNDRFQTH